jgi:Virulence-associated protein E/Bifunctional DNA primase/polymerase, N-terminal
MTQTLSAIFAYYARIGAALFPIPAGQKDPTGIVARFSRDWSRDPEQWRKWAADNPGCNWGVVSGPGNMITADIDIKAGLDAAWAAYCALCTEWGIDPAQHMPHVRSPSGGWHVYFQVPEGVDARTLRQPDAIKGVINIRAGNGYVVAAGSVVDGKPYELLSDAPAHPAPDALVKHCTRGAGTKSDVVRVGSRDKEDVKGLGHFLKEQKQFEAYEDWIGFGMAVKVEYGDCNDALEIWRIAHDETVTEESEESHWNSFATEPVPGVQTLNTWIQRARKIGWHKNIRKTMAATFPGVEAIAAAAGAQLPGSGGAGDVPLTGGQAALARIAGPILDAFLAVPDLPTSPYDPNYPRLLDSMASHPLYDSVNAAIARIVGMADNGSKGFKHLLIHKPLAVVYQLSGDVYGAVLRTLAVKEIHVAESKVKKEIRNLEGQLERAITDLSEYKRDPKSNEIQHNNPDNLNVFLGDVGIAVRWNDWLKRPEVQAEPGSEFYSEWPTWTLFDDDVAGRLIARAEQTGTRFMVRKEWFWDRTLALSRQPANRQDPAKERIKELQDKWDRVPRLWMWLKAACGAPVDAYHKAVGANIIGGMVRRIRQPGCKHDTCAVFIGPQGFKKSWLCKLISPDDSWFTDSVPMGETAKELLGLLTGKAVVEFAEMSKRTKDWDEIKGMITRQSDFGRPPYAKGPEDRQRRCIFMATTNDDTPLRDDTGNRRFLPVRVNQMVDIEWLEQNIRQLVGEAAYLESKGADFRIPDDVLEAATAHQETARLETGMEIQLAEWFRESDLSPLTYITKGDLVELHKVAGWREGPGARNNAMKRLGFRDVACTEGKAKIWVWVRGPNVLPKYIPTMGARYEFSNVTGRIRVKANIPNTPRV